VREDTMQHKKVVYSKYLEYFNFSKKAQILDVCGVTDGNGNLQSLTEVLLRNEKFFVTGVDLRRCKVKAKNFKFTQGDILDSSFKENAFDYIICSNAIQLIGMKDNRLKGKAILSSGDRFFLDGASRWLKNGGRILIDTTVNEKVQVLDFTDQVSWRVYTVEKLQDMLVSRGFKIIYEMYYDGAKDTKTVIPSATGYLIVGEKEVRIEKPKRTETDEGTEDME